MSEDKKYIYPSISARLIAGMIDLVVVSIPYVILAYILGVNSYLTELFEQAARVSADAELTQEDRARLWEILWEDNKDKLIDTAYIIVGCTVLAGFICTYPAWILKGKSIGKHICCMRIVDEADYKKPDAVQYFIRFVGYILIIGHSWIIFNKRRRSLHDILSGTIVIYEEDRWFGKLWKKFKDWVKSLFKRSK